MKSLFFSVKVDAKGIIYGVIFTFLSSIILILILSDFIFILVSVIKLNDI